MLEQKLLSFSLLGAEWVMWLLIGMSVLCLAIAVERAVYLALNKTNVVSLQDAIGAFLKKGDIARFHRDLSGLKGVEARILTTGVDAAMTGGPAAAEEAISGAMVFEKMKLDRGLIVLGTTGSNAPFIGLFGTVLGIIKAFHELASNTEESANAVMAGISEALVATAIGLMVAIPAVILFNVFQRQNKGVMGRVESLGHFVLARMKSTEGLSEAETEIEEQTSQAMGA